MKVEFYLLHVFFCIRLLWLMWWLWDAPTCGMYQWLVPFYSWVHSLHGSYALLIHSFLPEATSSLSLQEKPFFSAAFSDSLVSPTLTLGLPGLGWVLFLYLLRRLPGWPHSASGFLTPRVHWLSWGAPHCAYSCLLTISLWAWLFSLAAVTTTDVGAEVIQISSLAVVGNRVWAGHRSFWRL